MDIDWFTFVAQIINFLILVWLLKRFLYGPVVKAMDQREAHIAAQVAETEHKRQEAEQEAASYRAMKETLAQQREEQLDRVKEEAATQRRQLLQEAREEVENVQAEWKEEVQREQETYLKALRHRMGAQVLATARRALHDLADVNVEEQIVRLFIQRLRTLDEEALKKLTEAINTAKTKDILIRSTFKISPTQRQLITSILHEQLAPDVTSRFVEVPDGVNGVELKAGGWKLTWSLESYLDALEDRFAEALEQGGNVPCTNRHNP